MSDDTIRELEKTLCQQLPAMRDDDFSERVQARLSRRRWLRLSALGAAWSTGLGAGAAVVWEALGSNGADAASVFEGFAALDSPIAFAFLLALFVAWCAWVADRITS